MLTAATEYTERADPSTQAQQAHGTTWTRSSRTRRAFVTMCQTAVALAPTTTGEFSPTLDQGASAQITPNFKFFCYTLVCNRQSICFMASEDFEKLRILSPTPSGPYIRPFIAPSFVVHGTLYRRSAAHLSRSRSAGCLACMPKSPSTTFRLPYFPAGSCAL